MKNLIIRLIIICLSIVLSTCKKESKQNPETDYIIYNNGDGSIGSGGGKITLNENNPQELSVSIDIPAGALAKSEFISIDIFSDALSNSPYSLGSLIELKPEGLIFNDSVKLTIKLNSPLNQDDNPIIYQYLSKRNYLKYNETSIDNNNNTIYTNIKHFSLWTYTLRHPDLRDLAMRNFPVYIDDYPSKPVQSYENIAALTKEDIMRAFSQWDFYTDKSFSLSTNVDEANIAVQFGTPNEADDFFGGDPLGDGASAVTLWYLGDLTERVILFNDDFTWASTEYIANNAKELIGSNINAEGVEFTALHEIGHLFGLQHYQTAQNPNAVMTPYCPSLFPRALTCTDFGAFSNQYSNSCANSLNSLGDLNIIAEAGSTINNSIKIKVKDINGNGVPGVTVIFYNDSNISMEFTKYTTTNIDGNAYLSEMQIPHTVGKINLIVYAYLSAEMKSLTYTIDIKDNTNLLTDLRDGHIYKTVSIGTQTWMAENLAYLPEVSPSSSGSSTIPYYYIYGYQGTSINSAKATDNFLTYSVLYNWPAAQNACPTGWHLPNDSEWHTLALTLDANSTLQIGTGIESNIAGGKLKEIGTTHWSSPNTGATNEYGFTALPGGNRDTGGTFIGVGSMGLWWGSTEQSPYLPWYRGLFYRGNYLERAGSYKSDGFSVRCIKD